MEFAKEELTGIKDFLDQEQKAGNKYVAYLDTERNLSKTDLAVFKSSYHASEHCFENSTDVDQYVSSPLPIFQKEVDRAIIKDALERSNVVERFDSDRFPLMVDALMANRPIYIHTQESVVIQERVSEYQVMAQPGGMSGHEAIDAIKTFSTHSSYVEAEQSFKQAIVLDTQKAEQERSNYVLAGKFDGIEPNFLENGQPQNGTGVTMKFAYLCYDSVKHQQDYAVATIHQLKDLVPLYQPHYVTADLDNRTLHFHENRPEPSKEKDNKLEPDKGRDMEPEPSRASGTTSKTREEDLSR